MAIALTVLEDSSRGTGACVLLEYEGRRLLLDCGYDDSGPLSLSPSLPVPAASLNAVVKNASPPKVLQKVKRYIRRDCRKPQELKV